MSSLGKNRRNDPANQAAQPLDPAIIRARDQIAKGDKDGGAAALRQFLRQPDLSLNTRLEVAKVLGTAGATADATAIYLDAGRKALSAGDFATARSSFAAAHALDQKGYDALFELGRVDLAEGQKEQALEKFVEVLRKSNLRHLPALYEAAVLYEADGQTDQAIAAYRKIAERDRHHVPTLTRLADLYRKKGLLGDALGYYLQGARAAMAGMHHKDARKLIDSALQIEDDNWEARRLQQELVKAAPDVATEPVAKEAPERATPSPQPSKPAPQPAVAQTPTSGRPVQPAVTPQSASQAPSSGAGVPAAPPMPPTRVTTPPARASNATPSPISSPAQPAFSGSDMDIELPPEVTLLEKQSEVTSTLAAITAEVAEAYKKRIAIERDIKAAQAALEALNAQRGTVESSIATLKQQLDSVNQTKAAEDKALEEVRSRLDASRADLEKLATLPQFIKDVEGKSSAAATVIANATTAIESAQRRIAEAQSKAGAVEKATTELIARMGAAKQQADEAQEQLKGLLADSKSAKSDATAVAASVAELKATLAALQQTKAQVDAASNELKSMSPALEAKRVQTTAALSQLDQKRAARDSQFQAATAQVSGASQAAAKAAPTSAPQAVSKPAPAQAAPAATPAAAQKQAKGESSKLDIDALVVAGRLDEALRAARESANGSSDPDARLIEAAERLRSNGNAAAAAKACEKLVSAGNSSSAVRYCLGFSYIDLKRFKEALSMFQAIAEPEYGVLRENGIGLCLRGLGRTDEAAQHFSRALEIPGQPDVQYREVLYNLADLYESRGDQESLNLSLWSFEEIQAGAPDYRDVNDRITSLKDQLAKIEVPEPNPVLTRDGRGGRDSRF